MEKYILLLVLFLFSMHTNAIEEDYKFEYKILAQNQLDAMFFQAGDLETPPVWKRGGFVYMLLKIVNLKPRVSYITFDITNNLYKLPKQKRFSMKKLKSQILMQNNPTFFLLKLSQYSDDEELKKLDFQFKITSEKTK